MAEWKKSVQLAYLQTIIYTGMSSWTKTWSGVKEEVEHKDQENETELESVQAV